MTKLEKIKPKPGSQRRNSTGNAAIIFNKPTPIPNYLRASIGSCHDLCKYGRRRLDPPAEPERERNRNTKKTSCRERKASEPKNLAPLSSRKQPKPKPKPLVRKLPDGKSKRSKKASSSVKIPSADIQTSKKSAENSESDEREKAIAMHVAEPNPNPDDHQGNNLSSPSCSSPNPKKKMDSEKAMHVPNSDQKMDSGAKPWMRAIGIGRVVMKENGSSPLRQRMKMERALGIGNGESLRRDGHGGDRDFVYDEDELLPVELACRSSAAARTPARISRCKVKALVDGFETMVNVEDSTSLRPYSRKRRYTWRGERCYTMCNANII